LNLQALKCVVVDEADVFFKPENFEHLWKLKDCKGMKEKNPPAQWILFSATFPEGVDPAIDDIIGKLVGKCIQIKVTAEASMERIKNIQQYVFQVEEKKKIDFIKDVFLTCEATQTFIFVNTKNFAERVNENLNKGGFKSYIMFSRMDKEERDRTMEKFRK
jgi:superfamily II DNA/RNA helicase|tara:strand:- start:417 stop:899 length:483 start_codon:yes stop_codon:yes gene_type:complete